MLKPYHWYGTDCGLFFLLGPLITKDFSFIATAAVITFMSHEDLAHMVLQRHYYDLGLVILDPVSIARQLYSNMVITKEDLYSVDQPDSSHDKQVSYQ